MAVTVVAILVAKPGLGTQLIESFREVSPLVHAEQGCEFYAAHLEQGGDTVVMIERWSTQDDLDAHAAGTPLARLNELNGDLLVAPYEVWMFDAVPLGDPRKGTIQAGGIS